MNIAYELRDIFYSELFAFLEYLHFGIIIVMGATASAFAGKEEQSPRHIITLLPSIFAGTLALFLGMAGGLEIDLLMAISGLSAWGGERSLRLIESYLVKRLNLKDGKHNKHKGKNE